MKVVYTLAGNHYKSSDIELAMQCAEAAAQQFGQSVRILLEGKVQYPVLSGVNNLSINGSTYKFRTIQGIIETRKQFKGAKGDIIVTVCPSLQLLQKLQDAGVSLLVVVPEMTASTDIYHWLDLNSAMDIQSHQPLQGIGLPAQGVMRAIGYLKDYCQRMTTNLKSTPVYLGELADVANTLKTQGIVAVYDEVVKYCLHRGLSIDEASIVAKSFSQKSMLKMRGNPNFAVYWKVINDPKWELIP